MAFKVRHRPFLRNRFRHRRHHPSPTRILPTPSFRWNWNIEIDDLNGDGEAGYYFDGNGYVTEPNVDEADENIPQRQDLSIFPLIPTIGFSIEL